MPHAALWCCFLQQHTNLPDISVQANKQGLYRLQPTAPPYHFSQVLFTLGLFLAGLLQWFVSPSSWLALPAHLSLWRSAVAAVLVAAGTYVGNGCTR